ncbi:conserved membrane protein of unknown function [Sterolibacterium denitrificans]|uniref:Uncharacterized protein n=3 Tax=Sterolibacterium denitrificans TaxID=157592 RepID=A0A656Z949_9PROT|nr:hypothetical protein ACY05_01650 [Sterolibacterium denitrificans]SMB30313.1 conserved membrane protein of unknown function [Sterolibacterium denitrificans]
MPHDMSMNAYLQPRRFTPADIRSALFSGWQLTRQTWRASLIYGGFFTLIGALILGLLLAHGFGPFVIAAAGAFMLVGPVILAGFFGIARAHERGQPTGPASVWAGFTEASSAIWVISLVCALLFMIFITDAAILYSYMVGGTPVWLNEFETLHIGVGHFLLWGSVSGFAIAFMLYCVSAFSIPLLCERRCSMVSAIVASVRAVFGNFHAALAWALLLAVCGIGSILLLPLLPVTLPWLSHASRALYRHVFP